MARVVYQIRVAGDLPDRFFEDFSRVTVPADPVGTVLQADLTDQAELNGLLDALRREGLELLEVRRELALEAEQDRPSQHPGRESS